MIAERIRIHGVIRGGQVVLDTRLSFPEGTVVQISFQLTELSPEFRDEFEAWNRASDNACAMITEWEQDVNQ